MAGGIYSGLGRGIQNALELFLSVDADQKARKRQAELDAQRAEQMAFERDLALRSAGRADEAFGLQQKQFNLAQEEQERGNTLDELLAADPRNPIDNSLAERARNVKLGHRLSTTVKPGAMAPGADFGVGTPVGVPTLEETNFRKMTPQEQMQFDALNKRNAALAKLPENVRPFAEGGVDPSLQFGVEDPKVVEARKHKHDLEKIAATGASYQMSRGQTNDDKWARDYNTEFDNLSRLHAPSLSALRPDDPRRGQIEAEIRQKAEAFANRRNTPQGGQPAPGGPSLDEDIQADLQTVGGDWSKLIAEASSPQGQASLQSQGVDPQAYVRRATAMKILARLNQSTAPITNPKR